MTRKPTSTVTRAAPPAHHPTSSHTSQPVAASITITSIRFMAWAPEQHYASAETIPIVKQCCNRNA